MSSFCGSTAPCSATLLALLLIGLSNGAIIALNALGFTLIYGATRTINLAHGDLFGLASAVAASTLVQGLNLLAPGSMRPVVAIGLAFAAAIVSGGAINLAVERVAFRPFRDQPGMAPMIATIAVSFMLFQAALAWRAPAELPALLPSTALLSVGRLRLDGREFDYVYRLPDLLVLLLALALTTLIGWFLRRTWRGRAIRAWSQDAEMARLCGVPSTRTIRFVFVLGGVLAGTAALASTLYYRHPVGSYGLESGLVALSAAVLGGIGRPAGVFASGLLIGVLSALSDKIFTAQWTPIAVLGLLIFALVLRPTGLSRAGGSGVSDTLAPMLASRPYQPGQPSRRLATVLIVAGLAYPLLDRALNLHEVIAAIGILFFVLLALGYTIILGFAGMVNLGYASCFALGAYTAALLTTRYGPAASLPRVDNFALVLLLCAAAAGLFGAAIGVVTRRMRGDYVAIVTLAGGQIVQRLFLNLSEWTGGRNGLAVLPQPRLLAASTTPPLAWYYVVLSLILIAALACRRLLFSRQGRAWLALREDETAAISCGIDPNSARLLALVCSTAIAGAAGACYASIIAYVDPNQADFRISAMVLAMVVIGGAGNIAGGVLGAILIAGVDQLAIPKLGASLAELTATPDWHWLAFLDLRALNLLAFGLALYVALLVRARRAPL